MFKLETAEPLEIILYRINIVNPITPALANFLRSIVAIVALKLSHQGQKKSRGKNPPGLLIGLTLKPSYFVWRSKIQQLRVKSALPLMGKTLVFFPVVVDVHKYPVFPFQIIHGTLEPGHFARFCGYVSILVENYFTTWTPANNDCSIKFLIVWIIPQIAFILKVWKVNA